MSERASERASEKRERGRERATEEGLFLGGYMAKVRGILSDGHVDTPFCRLQRVRVQIGHGALRCVRKPVQTKHATA